VKVVLDSNIYISDALFDALAEKAVNAAIDGQFSAYVSEFILNEVRKVLVADFGTTRRFAALTIKRIGRIARVVPTRGYRFPDLSDQSDHPILETAINCSADYLVTGDKRLLGLSPFRGIRIIGLREFCNLLGPPDSLMA
jgi:putative PIN family toxin of toxin-antitoxin system